MSEEESDYILIEDEPNMILNKIKKYINSPITAVTISVEDTDFADGVDIMLDIGDLVLELYGASVFKDMQEIDCYDLMSEIHTSLLCLTEMKLNQRKIYQLKIATSSFEEIMIQAYGAIVSKYKEED